jgi:uncharacterized protein YqfA (UPF0365 family)
MAMSWIVLIIVIVFLLVLLSFVPIGLWISAWAAGVSVGLLWE